MTPFEALARPRVLIVAMSGIGNLLMQSPAWTRIKEAHPRAEITVLVDSRGTADVLERNKDIHAILSGKPKPSFREWIGMVRAIQEGRFDVGIVTFPGQLITSSSILFFGGVNTRVGHRYTYRFLRRTSLFLNNPIAEVQPLHDVVQNLRLLDPLGMRTDAENARYVFPLGPEDHAAAETFLADRGLSGARLIGIHPGAYRDLAYKRWPADRWSELGKRLAKRYDAHILIVGGPNERALKTIVWNGIGENASQVDLPLRATAALIRRCSFFVSNDSGLMHVAVSQDVETFGLFGPTDERRTAPWGPKGRVIRAPGTHTSYDVRELSRIRLQHEAHPSLLALTVAEVFHTIEKDTVVDT